MAVLQIESVDDPFTHAEAARAASVLLARAEAIGLLDDLGVVSRLDLSLVAVVLQRLSRMGLLQRAVIDGQAVGLPHDPDSVARLLDQANEVLEDSPLPDWEWPALRSILGDELLARLCGISESSLRRYAARSRPTPDAVAQRLHSLALIMADLRGAYNDYGVRRWFQRPRTQLGGRAPVDFLPAGWVADGPEALALRNLAGALVGSPAT